jgi:hypothetical protein
MSIQCRLEENHLTTPHSYSILVVPRDTNGYVEMAADISAEQPLYSPETVSGLAPLIMKWIQKQLINGNQVTLTDAVNFHVSCTGKLDNPDDPLPEDNTMLQVNVRVSQPFVKEIRHQAKLERLPMTEKLPVITSTQDTKLKLADVLYAAGVLKLTGTNLYFEENSPNCGCVIAGTRNGTAKQSTYASIANSSIFLVPDIPSQDAPWNNEYTVTVTTKYTAHGTPRSGTCRHKLRTPLSWDGLAHEGGVGILTGSADVPYVTIESGTVAANEMLRIQAMIDSRNGLLMMNLLDMNEEGGQAGVAVTVMTNGDYVLPGFSGSSVSNVHLTVHEQALLVDLIKNSYSGRLVDIIDIRLT